MSKKGSVTDNKNEWVTGLLMGVNIGVTTIPPIFYPNPASVSGRCILQEKKIYLISIGFRVVEPVQEGVELVLPDNLTSLAGDPRLQLTEMMGWKDNADVLHIKGITY